MNYYLRYILVLIILMVLGYIFEKYKQHEEKIDQMDQYDLIKKYLLTDSSLAKTDKPILWIPIQFEKNARWWPSFYSRNTQCLNQPYQYLTLKSIIDKCGKSFNVCLIDDRSFNNIIPGWTTKIANLPNPLKPHLRELAMSKLLYYYGGMTLPSSFICFKDLISLYNRGLGACDMFTGELNSSGNVMNITEYFPNNKIMGCKKECVIMEQYINYLEGLVSNDYTNEMEFTSEPNRWLYKQVLNNKVMVLDAEYFGVKQDDNSPVIIDDLLGNDDDFKLSNKAYGLYIPANDILTRTNMQWFARMNAEQVLNSNTIISRYLLLCN